MRSKAQRNIFFAALLIVLCTVLMVSTTLTLFTSQDDVNLRVTAGTLEIDLLQADETGKYESIADESGDLFGGKWEPNYTKIVFFKVQNNGTVPLKYSFRLHTKMDGMDGALEYCAVESGYFDPSDSDWEQFTANAETLPLQEGVNVLTGSSYITLNVGESRSYAVAVHMLAGSANKYQGKSCVVDVNVFAVQGNANV